MLSISVRKFPHAQTKYRGHRESKIKGPVSSTLGHGAVSRTIRSQGGISASVSLTSLHCELNFKHQVPVSACEQAVRERDVGP